MKENGKQDCLTRNQLTKALTREADNTGVDIQSHVIRGEQQKQPFADFQNSDLFCFEIQSFSAKFGYRGPSIFALAIPRFSVQSLYSSAFGFCYFGSAQNFSIRLKFWIYS